LGPCPPQYRQHLRIERWQTGFRLLARIHRWCQQGQGRQNRIVLRRALAQQPVRDSSVGLELGTSICNIGPHDDERADGDQRTAADGPPQIRQSTFAHD
jgi:hypothetical protein